MTFKDLHNEEPEHFQYNTFLECGEYICHKCSVKFNSCKDGLLFDDESYCSIECLIDYLTTNRYITDL